MIVSMTTGWNRCNSLMHGVANPEHPQDLSDPQGNATETQPTYHPHNRLDTTNMMPPRYDQDTGNTLYQHTNG
jgi:hypothetical protein